MQNRVKKVNLVQSKPLSLLFHNAKVIKFHLEQIKFV